MRRVDRGMYATGPEARATFIPAVRLRSDPPEGRRSVLCCVEMDHMQENLAMQEKLAFSL